MTYNFIEDFLTEGNYTVDTTIPATTLNSLTAGSHTLTLDVVDGNTVIGHATQSITIN